MLGMAEEATRSANCCNGVRKKIPTAVAKGPATVPSSADRNVLTPSEIRNMKATMRAVSVDCLIVQRTLRSMSNRCARRMP